MKQENDKLRNLLQEVFNDYEVTPDPEDWNRIAESLNKAKGRRRFLWAAWSAAATILLLLAIYTGNEILGDRSVLQANRKTNVVTNYSNHTTPIKSQVPIAKGTNTKALNHRTSIKPEGSQKVLANNPNTISKRLLAFTSGANHYPAEKKSQAEPVKNISATKNNQSEKIISDKTPVTNINGEKERAYKAIANNNNPAKADTKEFSPTQANPDKAVSINSILAATNEKKETKEEKAKEQLAREQLYALKENREAKQLKSTRTFILTGLAIGNSSGFQPFSGNNNNNTDMNSYADPRNGTAASLTSSLLYSSNKIFDFTSSNSQSISTLYQNIERNYKPPLTLALTATFSLGNRFSMETGFQYTSLKSDGNISIKSSNDMQFILYNVNESLEYVGIPVMLNYTLVEKKKFKTFISSGFSIDKGIQAHYNATAKNNIPTASEINTHNSIKGLQESFSGGIGLSYTFIPHFEFYLQPSVTYYFKSSDSNATIYSINPWLINLRSGIRYNFK